MRDIVFDQARNHVGEPMCITPGSRLFVRRDSDGVMKGKLPDLAKTKVTPAMHMNFGGQNAYTESGFLSLFLYDPTQQYPYDGQHFEQSAYLGITTLTGGYIHYLFIPDTVQPIALTDDTVSKLPDTGRTPTLFDSRQCNPPARINLETGAVLEYANRYICEYLYAGAWVQGMKVVTERADSSHLLNLMRRLTPTDDICTFADKFWPCGPPDPGSGGTGPGSSFGSVKVN